MRYHSLDVDVVVRGVARAKRNEWRLDRCKREGQEWDGGGGGCKDGGGGNDIVYNSSPHKAVYRYKKGMSKMKKLVTIRMYFIWVYGFS